MSTLSERLRTGVDDPGIFDEAADELDRLTARVAELSIRQEMAAFVIARETAFDLPGRPRKELGYIVPAGSVSFPTQEAAHEAHREMGLPLGWVVMRLEQLVATPPQPAPDTVLVPREPTIAMLEAFREADEQRFGPHFHDAYRAMIAAAPKSTP